jgi:putative membrane protein
MNRASFKEFRRQSPKGIVINYGVLLFKLVKSFWVLIPIFFSKNIEDKWDYIISVIGGLFLVLFVIAVVQYIYFKFKIVGDQFVLNKGMIFKKKLAIPIERIQSVNFKQNIVHQIIQVTQVEIQTAGAKDVEVSIKALSR